MNRFIQRWIWIVHGHHSLPATARGESDAKYAQYRQCKTNLIVGRRHERIAGHQPQVRNVTNIAPTESAADEISVPIQIIDGHHSTGGSLS